MKSFCSYIYLPLCISELPRKSFGVRVNVYVAEKPLFVVDANVFGKLGFAGTHTVKSLLYFSFGVPLSDAVFLSRLSEDSNRFLYSFE